VNHTVADVYLTQVRKIPKPPAGWPSTAVRFYAPECVLVVIATTPNGIVQAAQGIQLTPDSAQKLQKKTIGVLTNAAVRLPAWKPLEGATGPLLVTEGPETGLTVWAATGYETWILLGKITRGSVVMPPGRPIILCPDDDKRFSPDDKKLCKSIR